MSNACESGYCSKGFSQMEVERCISSLSEGWNGLCAYQDGSKISDPEEEIVLTCCESGCKMKAHVRANWNGLCAYQRNYQAG